MRFSSILSKNTRSSGWVYIDVRNRYMAPLVSMLVLPAAYWMMLNRRLQRAEKEVYGRAEAAGISD